MVVAVTSATSTAGPGTDVWPGPAAPPSLLRLIDGLGHGVAVLSGDERILHVNPAGCAILESRPEDLVGRRAPAPLVRRGHAGIREEPDAPPGGHRELECSDTWLEAGGRRVVARTFRDVTA
jgi:PAS domain-containing protein